MKAEDFLDGPAAGGLPSAEKFLDDGIGKPAATDYLKGVASGVGGLVSGVGYLAEAAGADRVGASIRGIGDTTQQYWQSAMTPAGQRAAKAQVFEDDPNSALPRLGDNWGQALAMGAAQSAPSMLAAALPGGIAAAGLRGAAGMAASRGIGGALAPLAAGTAAPIVGWATNFAGNVAARAPAALGFGAAEGAVAGASNAAQWKSDIEQRPEQDLDKMPGYAQLKAQIGPEAARRQIAEKGASDIMARTTLATGGIGALTGGGALGSAFQRMTAGAKGGIAGAIARDAAKEAGQEVPQSGGERAIQNLATRDYLDQNQSVSQGVVADALSGGAIGGLMGGVTGGASHLAKGPLQKAVEVGSATVSPNGGIAAGIPAGNSQIPAVNAQPAADGRGAGAAAASADASVRDLVQAAAAEMESDQSPVAAPPQQNTPAAPGNLSASAPTAAPSLPTNQAEPAGVPVSQQRGIPQGIPQNQAGPAGSPASQQQQGALPRGNETEITKPAAAGQQAQPAATSNAAGAVGNTNAQPAPTQVGQDVNMQNRDRSRAASVIQMGQIARNPDYMRLGPSRTPDSGAPMVFAVNDDHSRIPATNFGNGDVAVMSDGQRVPFRYAIVSASKVEPSNFADGRVNPAFAAPPAGTIKALNNGRTAGLRAAYEIGSAGTYQAELANDLANVGISLDALRATPNPILVRVYSDAANAPGMATKSQAQGLGMSPAELARQDAPLIDSSVIEMFRPGDVAAADNRDFVRAFLGRLRQSGQDIAGMMTDAGTLSPMGRQRIQAALMQAAYGDADLVAELFDSIDTDIKAIGEALKAVAGAWANMRDSARLGAIAPEVDITGNLVAAVRLIQKARRDGASLFDLINQRDIETGEAVLDLTVEALRLFYTGKFLTRAVGKDKLISDLEKYLSLASATSAGADLFGNRTSAADLLTDITKGRTDEGIPGERKPAGVPPAGPGSDGAGQGGPGRRSASGGNPAAQGGGRGGSQGQGGQEAVIVPPAAPAATLSYEEFSKQYRDAFANAMRYSPNEVGAAVFAERMAKLADDYPEFLARLEAEEEGKKARPALDLRGQTPEEVAAAEADERAKAEAEKAAVAAEAAAKKAAEKQSLDDAIKKRAENPDNFQFGEDGKAAAKPMGGIFERPSVEPSAQSRIVAPDSLNLLRNPVGNGDTVLFADGSKWVAKTGWTGGPGAWTLLQGRKEHPTIKGIDGQSELIRAIAEEEDRLRNPVPVVERRPETTPVVERETQDSATPSRKPTSNAGTLPPGATPADDDLGALFDAEIEAAFSKPKEKSNEPGSVRNSQRDRKAADAQQGDEGAVSNERGRESATPGGGVRVPDANSRGGRPGGSGVSGTGAASGGKRGDQPVPGTKRPAGVENLPAGDNQRQGSPGVRPGGVAASGGEGAAAVGGPAGGGVVPRSASEAGKSAAKNAGMALSEVAKGLNALFKPKPGTLGSGPSFDEDTYAAAKPYFQAGLAHVRQAGADIVEMMRALIAAMRDQFGMDKDTIAAMKPYVVRYIGDVKAGREAIDETNPQEPQKDKIQQQQDAEPIKVIVGDKANIDATLPFLTEGQREDVLFAEKRWATPDGYGVLFTNGTGTGKTFLALGAIKRLTKQGKSNGIVVVPNEAVMNEWVKSAPALGLRVNPLTDTKDAGSGIAITTYANFGQNDEIAKRDYDFVAIDEAHLLMLGKDAEPTKALGSLRAVSLHPDGILQRAEMQNRDLVNRIGRTYQEIDSITKSVASLDTMQEQLVAAQKRVDELSKVLDADTKEWQATLERTMADVIARQGKNRPRVMFLSATPFAYEPSVQWGKGFLYDFPKVTQRGYNAPNGYQKFMMQHFGWRMRYGKLTQPPAEVDSDLMQRQFNTWLRKEGVLSARMLDVDHDYERKFILIQGGVGQTIDDGLRWLRETDNGRYWGLYHAINEKFDYLTRSRLLEAIKARAAIPYIKKHHALGRKVVVFYDFNSGGGINVFNLSEMLKQVEDGERMPGYDIKEHGVDVPVRGQGNVAYGQIKTEKIPLSQLIREFMAARPDLQEIDFSRYGSPLTTLLQAFPGAGVYNGMSQYKKTRIQSIRDFNDDAKPEANLLLVQKMANAGWSGHDTTGKNGRVVINLGLPVAPIEAIQQEGRIYRVGQKSDANFQYFNTGTNWERYAFGSKIARRAGTAENLAMGEQARGLREAFIQAFENSDPDYEPGEADGKGGKTGDRDLVSAITEWDRARSLYFAQQKKTSRTKAAEGEDYYATPEPLGLKMVEWAGILPGERVLEPSAGHGAIARWFPDKNDRTVIEPSLELASRLALATDAKLINERFENHDTINKYDAIVMNPPFGVGGKTAIEHLDKAFRHLTDGGRIVALIPEGPAANKRFDDWLYGDKQVKAKPVTSNLGTFGAVFLGDTATVETSGGAGIAGGGIGTSTATGKVTGFREGKLFVQREGSALATGYLPDQVRSVQPTGARTATVKSAPDAYLRASISLPAVTFERAGTAVKARVVVVDKISEPSRLREFAAQSSRDIDADSIKELFDRIENMDVAGRALPADKARAQKQEADFNAAKAANAGKMDDAGIVQPSGAPATVETIQEPEKPGDQRKLLTDAPRVEYVTKAGKTIFGVIAKRLTKDQAKSIDPYMWAKDGGFFIRMAHVVRPPNVVEQERAVYTVNEPDRITKDLFSGLSGDLFPEISNALPDTKRSPLERKGATPPRSAGASSRSSARVLAVRQTPDAPGIYHVSTQLVTVGERALPVSRINPVGRFGVIDAAKAFAYLPRHAVEHYDAIVTDKAGKPLAVIGSFKGALTQASVYPSTVIAELSRIDGAAHLWAAHNHPSGVAELSRADENLDAEFSRLLDASGVEYHGLFAMAKKVGSSGVAAYHHTQYGHGEVASDLPTNHRVPIVERELIDERIKTEAISSPEMARAAVPAIAGEVPGIVFLDAQNAPVAFVPFSGEELGKLKVDGRLMRLFRSVSQANAGGAIVAMPDGKVTKQQVANVNTALSRIDVNLLDGIEYSSSDPFGTSVSIAQIGGLDSSGVVFSLAGQQSEPAVSAPPTDRAVYEMAQDGKQTLEILAFLAKASRRPFNRVLATALLRLGISPAVKVGMPFVPRAVSLEVGRGNAVFPEKQTEGNNIPATGNGNILEQHSLLRHIDDLINAPRNMGMFVNAANGVDGHASPEKSSFNRVRLDAELLRNIIEKQSFIEQGFGVLDVESKRAVSAAVLRSSKNQKVLDSVIKLIPVDVVNVLRLKKLAPDMLLHNPAMLARAISENLGFDVPTGRDVSRSLVRSFALATAIEGSGSALSDVHRLSMYGGSARGAFNSYHGIDYTRLYDNNGKTKYSAAYSPKTNTVLLLSPRKAEADVLHELVHAATLKAIEAGGMSAVRMKALFNHVAKSGKLEGMYGMTNVDEFVAEAFSNPKFREALQGVAAPAGSTLKNAWEWFVQIVARILGFQSIGGTRTALDRVLREGVALMEENAAIRARSDGGDRFAIAWHGTPHVWAPEPGFPHGRPRLDKIGTGEGAQAYGWGWYSADARHVAASYRPLDTFSIDGEIVDSSSPQYSTARAVWDQMQPKKLGFFQMSKGGTKQRSQDEAIDSLVDLAKRNIEITKNSTRQKSYYADIIRDNELEIAELEQMRGAKFMPIISSLYQLDIPDDVMPKLLDWDKPLNEQSPEVRAILQEAGFAITKNSYPTLKQAEALFSSARVQRDASSDIGIRESLRKGWDAVKSGDQRAFNNWFDVSGSLLSPGRKKDKTGQQFYEELSSSEQGNIPYSKQKASEYLASIGIPGLRYLDAGSRADGTGTYNYVLWDQPTLDRIALLERNGERLDAIRAADEAARFNVRSEPIELRSDIPNEEWLKRKVDYAKSKGKNSFGVPYMGTVTGTFNKQVSVPVETLSRLKGALGEQSNVRGRDLQSLLDVMKNTGRLPLNDSGKEYAPFVTVAYDGSAWVNEGNHRIMAAAKLGWDKLPVEVRYFDGGELADGPMNPSNFSNQMANDDTRFNLDTEDQFAATEREIGGRAAYDKAKAAGNTKLNYRQWVQVRTPAFKAWFGDWEGDPGNASKVVDPDTGEPMVVYHGTSGDFSEFRRSRSGEGFHFGTFEQANARIGSSPPVVRAALADGGPGDHQAGRNLIPVYLAIANPVRLPDLNDWTSKAQWLSTKNRKQMPTEVGDMAWRVSQDESASNFLNKVVEGLSRLGHDGVVYENVHENRKRPEDSWIAFRPEQIKSSTANTGAFSDDPDIRYNISGPQSAVTTPAAPGNLWQAAKAKAAAILSPDRIDKLIYELQDKHIDLRRIRDHIREVGGTITDMNDAYLGEELYHKRLAHRTQNFMKDELRPLLADMKSRGVGMQELESFLHARHAPEANAEMAKRNPNQAEIDAGHTKAAAVVRRLELNLQTAQARGLATKALEQALNDARGDLAKWNGAQAFSGTEEERRSLSGMTDQAAAAIMAGLSPRRRSDLDTLAARVDDINAGTLQHLDDYGLMSKESLDAWRRTYQFYVPLHRDEAHPDSANHPIGQGFSVKGDATKRRTGSNQKVTHILGHIAMQREAALTRGEKNRVMLKLYLMARQNPLPDVWKVGAVPMLDTIDKATGFVKSIPDPLYKSRPNVVTLRIAGKDVAIIMNEHNPQALRMAQALKNLDVDDLHYLIPVVGKATRYFAAINTQYNPIFGIINLMRDIQGAALNLSTTELAGKQGQIFKDQMSILGGVLKNKGRMPTSGPWAAILEEFNAAGGTTGYRDLYLHAEDRAKALLEELKTLDRGQAGKAAYAVLDWLSDYNEAMENATRLAAYKAALDQGMSKERAASLAKNLTVNFNRKGRQTRELGALYAFLNASIQGTTRMAQTLAGPAGRKIMAGGVALGALSAMLGIAMMGGGDDDEWSKIPEFVKERSLIIPIDRDKYITVPMPLGFHFLPNIGRLAVEMAFYKSKTAGKQMASLFTILADAFNPLGGSAPIAQIVTPTVLDPVAALMQNKDWTGKPIYIENFNSLDQKPGTQRAKDSATPWAKGFAEAINAITGGTEYTPGGWSPTPDQIDYVIGQLTGGVGREAGKVAATAAAPFTGEELPPYRTPLIGRLYGSTSGASGQSEAFYENIQQANAAESEIKGRLNGGVGIADFLKGNPHALELAALGNAADRQVRELRWIRRGIVNRGEPDAASKVREINERMAAVMRRFNRQAERMQ